MENSSIQIIPDSEFINKTNLDKDLVNLEQQHSNQKLALLNRIICFKGSRDSGFRGEIAA